MMIIIRSLTLYAGLLLSSSQIAAHEFWIEASKHYGEPDETVALILKVGETFRGSAQPLLPDEVERFVHVTDKSRTIDGLLGTPDRQPELPRPEDSIKLSISPRPSQFGSGKVTRGGPTTSNWTGSIVKSINIPIFQIQCR